MTTEEEYPILLSVTPQEALELLGTDPLDMFVYLADPRSFGKINNRAYLRLKGIKYWMSKKNREILLDALLKEDWDELEES